MQRNDVSDDRLCRLLGIEVPIVQAPMAGASTPRMARAVREAGGLGSLACAALAPDALDDLLREEQSAHPKTRRGPLHVNFFAHPPPPGARDSARRWISRLSDLYAEQGVGAPRSLSPGAIVPFDEQRCAIVEARRPEIVSFHFGLPPAPLVERLKRAGALLMSSATTVQEARWLAERGCDVVIAQGLEAGGHRATFLRESSGQQMGTLALVPQVVDAVDVPVVAAGGIADGRGIAAAFALGACGAQIGTAFLFTREASISPLHLDALREAGTRGTTLTNVISGQPARCVRNRIIQELGPKAAEAPPFPLGFAALAPLRAAAEPKGSPDFSAHYAGQAAGLCQEERLGAGALVRRLARQLQGRSAARNHPFRARSPLTGAPES